jgi:acyl-CoA synthetase (AMP-forming)/AMP-acid ligase II
MVFRRPHLNLGYLPDKPEGVNGLAELIEFNAVQNPDSTFCLQTRAKGAAPCRITFSELQAAVERCCAWLIASGSTSSRDGGEKCPAPVGVLLGSDITIFIYTAALLRLGTPVSTEKRKVISKLSSEIQVLCLSARLTPISIAHLLNITSTSTVLINNQVLLISKETSDLIAESSTDKKSSFIEALGYEDFLNNEHPAHASFTVPPAFVYKERHELGAVIMHSSGTTGLPKPVYHSPSYHLIYAACHRMPEQIEPFAYNVSTVPLYHVSYHITLSKVTNPCSRIRDLVSLPHLWHFRSVCLAYYHQHQ